MAALIGHASQSEYKSKNGAKGDQTGKEVYIRDWYKNNWNAVLRPKSAALAEASAQACEAGCRNNNIGYGQSNRNSAYTEWLRVKDISKLGKCNTDCSAYMTLCAIIGGCTKLKYSGNAPTTSNMVSKFRATGQYQVLRDSKYLTSPKYLQRGDILVAEGHHTVMFLTDNGNISDYTDETPDSSGSYIYTAPRYQIDASRYEDLKARIKSYRNLKEEFYKLDVDDDEKIDQYIEMFQSFNDEFLDEIGELGVSLIGTSSSSTEVGYETTNSNNIVSMTDDEIDDFVNLARSKIGCQYVWGDIGPNTFDCSGLVYWCMKERGIIPKSAGRFTTGTIPTCGYFINIPWKNRKRGDVLIPNGGGHVVIYEGNGKVVHASNRAPYPKGGVKESNEYFTGKAYRIKGYGVS